MPWWVVAALIIGGICSGIPFLYACKIARENGNADLKPIWWGGSANLYVVPRILREHAERGDYWAPKARLLYLVGVAIGPALIICLGLYDWWFR